MIPVPHGLMAEEPIHHQILYQAQREQIHLLILEPDGVTPKVIKLLLPAPIQRMSTEK